MLWSMFRACTKNHVLLHMLFGKWWFHWFACYWLEAVVPVCGSFVCLWLYTGIYWRCDAMFEVLFIIDACIYFDHTSVERTWECATLQSLVYSFLYYGITDNLVQRKTYLSVYIIILLFIFRLINHTVSCPKFRHCSFFSVLPDSSVRWGRNVP